MRKPWVLDTDTKGTGARMVPLEKVEQERAPRPPRRARSRPEPQPRARQQRKPRPAAKAASPLPPGHVRKKDTGEIGRLRSVDPRAGTATVHWLKRGNISVVPLSSVARR